MHTDHGEDVRVVFNGVHMLSLLPITTSVVSVRLGVEGRTAGLRNLFSQFQFCSTPILSSVLGSWSYITDYYYCLLYTSDAADE